MQVYTRRRAQGNINVGLRAPARGILHGLFHMKLEDQLRGAIRLKHFSLKTEESYVGWYRRFVLWHGKRHPREMGVGEIEAFLTHLAVNRGVASSTQNQALDALIFLYREVLKIEVEGIDARRAKRRRRLPVSAASRSCWGTRMCGRRRFTRNSPARCAVRSRARWTICDAVGMGSAHAPRVSAKRCAVLFCAGSQCRRAARNHSASRGWSSARKSLACAR